MNPCDQLKSIAKSALGNVPLSHKISDCIDSYWNDWFFPPEKLLNGVHTFTLSTPSLPFLYHLCLILLILFSLSSFSHSSPSYFPGFLSFFFVFFFHCSFPHVTRPALSLSLSLSLSLPVFHWPGARCLLFELTKIAAAFGNILYTHTHDFKYSFRDSHALRQRCRQWSKCLNPGGQYREMGVSSVYCVIRRSFPTGSTWS